MTKFGGALRKDPRRAEAALNLTSILGLMGMLSGSVILSSVQYPYQPAMEDLLLLERKQLF
jgi:hypothetical protein